MSVQLQYDPKSNLVNQISETLAIARDNGKEGAVGNALVGAKLHMRYGDIEIVCERYECRDDCFGCYQIGDSVLFVLAGLDEKALELLLKALDSNKRAFIYVPTRLLPIYRGLFEGHRSMRVSIGGIEAFVATTVEELSEYRSDLIGETLARLVAECERRVKVGLSENREPGRPAPLSSCRARRPAFRRTASPPVSEPAAKPQELA